jgi:dUTP pyrophosphatase
MAEWQILFWLFVFFAGVFLSQTSEVLNIQLLSKNARLPIRGTTWSAGLDLFSPINITLVSGNITVIPLDVAMEIPRCCYGRLVTRSSMGIRQIEVIGGVIDNDYRGNLLVPIINWGPDYLVKQGDRIAQLVIERISYPAIYQVDQLSPTERKGGFGSTGL